MRHHPANRGSGQAADAETRDAEQAAGEELGLHFLGEQIVHGGMFHARHRRDEDLVELVAAEHDARDVPDGHADAPLDAAVRRVADEVARDELRVPQAALLVDRGAVGHAGVVAERGEHPLVGERAGGDVVVVGPVLALERVGEIERPVVRAPARTVRADDALVDLRHAEVGVEAPEAADLQFFLVVHAAGEEAAAAVALCRRSDASAAVRRPRAGSDRAGRWRNRRSRSRRRAPAPRRRLGAARARRRRGRATSVRSCPCAGPAARSTGCPRAARFRRPSTGSLPRHPTPGLRRDGCRTPARIRSRWSCDSDLAHDPADRAPVAMTGGGGRPHRSEPLENGYDPHGSIARRESCHEGRSKDRPLHETGVGRPPGPSKVGQSARSGFSRAAIAHRAPIRGRTRDGQTHPNSRRTTDGTTRPPRPTEPRANRRGGRLNAASHREGRPETTRAGDGRGGPKTAPHETGGTP